MRTPTVGRFVAVLLTCLCASSARGQDATRDAITGDKLRELCRLSGIGIVGGVIAGETGCEPNANGESKVPLYDAVNGKAVASLEWKWSTRGSTCAAFLIQDDRSLGLYRDWDRPEIAYEALGLAYYEIRNGFARVFEHTVSPGLWVRISDLPNPGLRTWSELLVERPRRYFGHDGRRLLEKPAADSRELVQLRERMVHASRVHKLVPTGELSGDWGEFDVVEYESDFVPLAADSEITPTGKRWHGWLRLVSDARLPEFWFYTRD